MKKKNAQPTANEAGQDVGAETVDTVMAVVGRRIRAAKKKLQKAVAIEDAVSTGKDINDDQKKCLDSKIGINAVLEELNKLEPLLREALATEVETATKTVREEALAEAASRMATAQEDVCASTVASSTQTAEDKIPDDVSQLVTLLYVSNVFGSFDSSLQYRNKSIVALLSQQRECNSQDKQLSVEDIQGLVDCGRMVVAQGLDEQISHKEALERCNLMAMAWLRPSDTDTEGTKQVNRVKQILEQIKSSEFFAQEPKVPIDIPQNSSVDGGQPGVPEMASTGGNPNVGASSGPAMEGMVPQALGTSRALAETTSSNCVPPDQAPASRAVGTGLESNFTHNVSSATPSAQSSNPRSFLPFQSLNLNVTVPPAAAPVVSPAPANPPSMNGLSLPPAGPYSVGTGFAGGSQYGTINSMPPTSYESGSLPAPAVMPASSSSVDGPVEPEGDVEVGGSTMHAAEVAKEGGALSSSVDAANGPAVVVVPEVNGQQTMLQPIQPGSQEAGDPMPEGEDGEGLQGPLPVEEAGLEQRPRQARGPQRGSRVLEVPRRNGPYTGGQGKMQGTYHNGGRRGRGRGPGYGGARGQGGRTSGTMPGSAGPGYGAHVGPYVNRGGRGGRGGPGRGGRSYTRQDPTSRAAAGAPQI